MKNLNFNEFQSKISQFKESDFPCILNEMPTKLIPHLENEGEIFCFLESAINVNGKGEYSIVAFGSHCVIFGEEIFEELEKCINQIKHLQIKEFPMVGSFFGYIPYTAVKHFEPSVNCGNSVSIPEGIMFLPKNLLIINNIKQTVTIASIFHQLQKPNIEEVYHFVQNAIKTKIPYTATHSNINLNGNLHENGFFANQSKEEYENSVKKCIDYIKKGDIFQVVPSIQFFKKFNKHPLEFYKNLKNINPSPYMFYFSSVFRESRFNIIGASPEILINCKNDEVTLRPLAGTVKRGINEEEDLENEKLLLANEKEISEHLMLLDLGRNDVGKVAEGVYVEKQMEIERYSHVMHISSTVKGKKKKENSMVDVLKSGLPAGTLSGAPKIRAMQIIAEVENIAREFYSGSVGYISANVLQTCIILRSVLIKDGVIYAQSGAGVVYDSIPEGEYLECIQKLMAITRAVGSD